MKNSFGVPRRGDERSEMGAVDRLRDNDLGHWSTAILERESAPFFGLFGGESYCLGLPLLWDADYCRNNCWGDNKGLKAEECSGVSFVCHTRNCGVLVRDRSGSSRKRRGVYTPLRVSCYGRVRGNRWPN